MQRRTLLLGALGAGAALCTPLAGAEARSRRARPVDPTPWCEARPDLARLTEGQIRLRDARGHAGFHGVFGTADALLPEAEAELTWLLRDWREEMLHPIAPAVVAALAAVTRAVGAPEAILLSGYRTQQTQAKLRAAGHAVADLSFHRTGQAIDVTFEDELPRAVEAARDLKLGGVGWYPGNGFIHLDSGPVRTWTQHQAAPTGLVSTIGPEGNRVVLKVPTVKERMARLHQVAQQQHRQGGGRAPAIVAVR